LNFFPAFYEKGSMINFNLNGAAKTFDGDPRMSLLNYLREIEGLVSVKNGCSGEAFRKVCAGLLAGHLWPKARSSADFAPRDF
jgi:xanthine dehydrogenase iron-sulfur cluster and FAD-binding subunit A